jgi:hypothetical protein
MEAVNNSGKKAKWIKSEIPGEEYVCSLCGSACWYYDVQKGVARSKFCPNCGAKMLSSDEFVDVDELIDLCKDVSVTKISLDKKGQTQLSNWLEEYRALLKRNTEMKVAYMTNERNDGIWRGICPKCSMAVSNREDVNFCGTCGQRLGWRLW